MTWPSLELRAAADESGNEMLLLVGAEPDRLWHQFTDEVVTWPSTSARACAWASAPTRSRRPTPAPRIACTASTVGRPNPGSCGRRSTSRPGIRAAVEQGCDERGVPLQGLWAQIPHYVPATCRSRRQPGPGGGAGPVGELSLPVGDLPSMAQG